MNNDLVNNFKDGAINSTLTSVKDNQKLKKAFKLLGISSIILNIIFIVFFVGILCQVIPVIINFFINKETWIGPVKFIALSIIALMSIKTVILGILNINNTLYFTAYWGIKTQKFRLAKIIMCIEAIFDIIISARLIETEIHFYGLSYPLLILPNSAIVIIALISIAYIIMSKKQHMEETNVQ